MWLLLKRSVLLCAVLLVFINADGQEKVFHGGLVLGANFTQVDGDSYYGYHKVGLTAGGIVNAHFTKHFGVSLELLYSQKGSRGSTVYLSPVIGSYVEKYNMTLNYAEVPLMLHLFYKRYDIEAGASYALLLKPSEWVQSDRQVVIDEQRNRFNTSDVNYIFGVARRMYKQLYLNVRFQYSMLSIRPSERIPAGYIYGNRGQFNNVLGVRVVYYL